MRCSLVGWMCLLLAGTMTFHCEGIKWLGFHRYRPNQTIIDEQFCQSPKVRRLLRRRQIRFCMQAARNVKSHKFGAVIRAAKLTLSHCLYNFQYRRWNCSSLLRAPKLPRELKTGTKEQAIVHAFAGFFLVYTFARECHSGRDKYCKCGAQPHWNLTESQKHGATSTEASNFKFAWTTCHDNIAAGLWEAQKFLGVPKSRKNIYKRRKKQIISRKKKMRAIMRSVNAHNYWMGMEVVRRTQGIKCQCHGVSGTCTTRTCFRKLDYQFDFHYRDRTTFSPYRQPVRRPPGSKHPINALLDFLKDPKMAHFNEETVLSGTQKFCTPPRPRCRQYTNTVPNRSLVFLKISPDFCKRDLKVGTHGTTGRRCTLDNNLAESKQEFHCSVMCCGRGYVTRNVTLKQRNPLCHHTCVLGTGYKLVCKDCVVTWHFCN